MTGKKGYSAGNTFSEGEVQLMDFVVNAILRGGDPSREYVER